MSPCEFSGELAVWIASMAGMLHGRLSFRLAPLLMGLLFAQGRQTVASWLRAAEVGDDFRVYYYFLGSLGRKVDCVAERLLAVVCKRIGGSGRILLGLDDSPTKRFGPHARKAATVAAAAPRNSARCSSPCWHAWASWR